jgi:hypothetical protein
VAIGRSRLITAGTSGRSGKVEVQTLVGFEEVDDELVSPVGETTDRAELTPPVVVDREAMEADELPHAVG